MKIAQLIPHDKALHALGGTVLFALNRLALLAAGFDTASAHLLAIAGAVLVAAGKEVYDRFHCETHTASMRDALATTTGALLAFSCTVSWA